jgi:hypothetical protein
LIGELPLEGIVRENTERELTGELAFLLSRKMSELGLHMGGRNRTVYFLVLRRRC